jgi:hypothetical protein
MEKVPKILPGEGRISLKALNEVYHGLFLSAKKIRYIKGKP